MVVEKRKVASVAETVVINNIAINPMKKGDSYKYLGLDENLGYVGPVNKERVTKNTNK